MPVTPIARYRPRPLLKCLAPRLGMSTAELSHAVGLPRGATIPSVTADQYFHIWDTIDGLLPSGLRIEDAQDVVRSPFNAQTLAFACCDDVAEGLRRLSLLMPLSSPLEMEVTVGDTLTISLRCRDCAAPLSPRQAAVQVAQIIEIIRLSTEHYVRPLRVSLPNATEHASFTPFFDAPVTEGPVEIELSSDDAGRRLVGHDTGSRPPIAAKAPHGDASEELRMTLLGILPSGRSDADSAASRLNTTKRSLQRRLQREGTSYGAVLEKLRHEMALHYLKQGDLRVEEVSLLLGFRDPNSFYRAFQGWTGMTPRAARAKFQEDQA